MRTATMFLLGPMLTGFVLCESVQRLGQVRRASRLPLTVPCSRLRCLNSSCPIGQVTRPSGWRMKQLTMLCRCTRTEMVVPQSIRTACLRAGTCRCLRVCSLGSSSISAGMNSAGHPRIIMLIFAVLLHELQEACFCFPSLRLLYGSRQEPFASF